MSTNLRIGLDIDDCLAGFWDAYCDRFDVINKPHNLVDHIITRNVQQILKNERDFWLNLNPLVELDFKPELYCTKRVNNKAWTRLWLQANGFPERPIYQMYYQHGNKADMIKGKVDVFIDDSFSNVVKCNNSGVPSLLLHTDRTVDIPFFKLYSLDKESIYEAYHFLKEWTPQNSKLKL